MAYAFDPKDDVETQWKKWSELEEISDLDFTIDDLRERTIQELTYVSKMDVREYTLFQKWCEVQERYPTVTVNDLWEGEKRVLEDDKQRELIPQLKNNIWMPANVDDYLNLEPELLYTNKEGDLTEIDFTLDQDSFQTYDSDDEFAGYDEDQEKRLQDELGNNIHQVTYFFQEEVIPNLMD